MRTARLVLALIAVSILVSGCEQLNSTIPLCPGPKRNSTALILMAQSVPSAAYAPCISAFPAGWTFGGEHIRNGRSEFWLNSDRAGVAALRVLLTAHCDLRGAVQVPLEAGEPQMEQYDEPKALPPTFSGERYYVFPGGCVTYRFSFLRGATFAQVVEVSRALTFVSRAFGVRELAKDGLVLCGRGVRCPG